MSYILYIYIMRKYNKDKQKIWASEHYQRNKQKMIEKASINNKITFQRNSKYVNDYLLSHPCVDCGNNNTIVLEFDHIKDDKKFNISDIRKRAYSLKTIQDEISKCEVRCANCHRIVTHNRRKENLI